MLFRSQYSGFHYRLEKKWQTCKPGSVSGIHKKTGSLSFIWPRHCWRDLATYPSRQPKALRLPAAKRAVLPFDRDIFGFATHETYGRECHHPSCALLPHLFTLSCPGGYVFQHSCDRWSFSVTLLQAFTRLPVRKHGALCCPDFPPRRNRNSCAAIERSAGAKI